MNFVLSFCVIYLK